MNGLVVRETIVSLDLGFLYSIKGLKIPALPSFQGCGQTKEMCLLFLFVLIWKIQEKKTSPSFLLAKFCSLAMPGLHRSVVC